jgi:hypothetical protein
VVLTTSAQLKIPTPEYITADFDQRPRPLHNRYTRTGTCVLWVMAVTYSCYKFVTASLPKRLVTAVSLLKPPPGSRSGLKNPLGLRESSTYNSFSRRSNGRGYRSMYEIPRNSNDGDWHISTVRYLYNHARRPRLEKAVIVI